MLLTLYIGFTVNWKGSLLDKWRHDFHEQHKGLSVASSKVDAFIHARLLLKLASRAWRSGREDRFMCSTVDHTSELLAWTMICSTKYVPVYANLLSSIVPCTRKSNVTIHNAS